MKRNAIIKNSIFKQKNIETGSREKGILMRVIESVVGGKTGERKEETEDIRQDYIKNKRNRYGSGAAGGNRSRACDISTTYK